ncbi:MAG: hypothetical protein Q8L82_10135 [Nitrosomonas sp.]|nr:hypothetical protein [Nitrosomonas sp.]
MSNEVLLTKRGKQASRKAAARKYGFLEVPLRLLLLKKSNHVEMLTNDITKNKIHSWKR